MVGGDICYQADLKQVKKLHWKETLQRGLSLIIDTNDEYDVKNLMERKSREKEVSNDFRSPVMWDCDARYGTCEVVRGCP